MGIEKKGRAAQVVHTHTNYRRCSHHMHSTWPYVNDIRTKNWKRTKAKMKPKQQHRTHNVMEKTTKWQQHQLQFRFNRTFSRKKRTTAQRAHTVRVFHPPLQHTQVYICRSILKMCLCCSIAAAARLADYHFPVFRLPFSCLINVIRRKITATEHV